MRGLADKQRVGAASRPYSNATLKLVNSREAIARAVRDLRCKHIERFLQPNEFFGAGLEVLSLQAAHLHRAAQTPANYRSPSCAFANAHIVTHLRQSVPPAIANPRTSRFQLRGTNEHKAYDGLRQKPQHSIEPISPSARHRQMRKHRQQPDHSRQP